MTRLLRSATRGSRGPNLFALCVTTLVVGYVYLNCDPVISGTELPSSTEAQIGPPEISLPPAPLSATPLDVPATGDATEIASNETAAPAVAADPNKLSGRWAMLFCVNVLQRGCEKFERIPAYSCNMYKQERIGGELKDGASMSLKLRHEPFSVYMKWLDGDKGRQIIYVDGQNENNLLVQLGGVKGRLLGVLSIDPNGSQALAESRYPITGAGLLHLARKVLEHRQHDLEHVTNCTCELYDEQSLNDRPCYLFVTNYASPEVNATYRKSMLYIDKEMSMPVCVRNYTWATDAEPATIDDQTLIEFYSYSNIEPLTEMADADFDRGNPSYRMRR